MFKLRVNKSTVRYLRFSLRTILIVTTISGLLRGFVATRLDRYCQQRTVLLEIIALEPMITYANGAPAGLKNLQTLRLEKTLVSDLTPLAGLESVMVFLGKSQEVLVPNGMEGRVKSY